MKKYIIEVFENQDASCMFTENINAVRKFRGWYATELLGEAAAEEAFVITNAPSEFLSPDQLDKRNAYKLNSIGNIFRSISVGDVVNVYNAHIDSSDKYLCCRAGWKLMTND